MYRQNYQFRNKKEMADGMVADLREKQISNLKIKNQKEWLTEGYTCNPKPLLPRLTLLSIL